MNLHEALLDAHRRLGLTIRPGLFGALTEPQKQAIVTLAEAGRRHAKTDLDRLDAAIRTLIDVRYDDDHTRNSARKALDALLNLKDGLGDPADPEADGELSDDPADEKEAVAGAKKAAKAAKAADQKAAKPEAGKPEAKPASGDSGSGKSIELKIAASADDAVPDPPTRRMRVASSWNSTLLAEGDAATGSTWDVLLIQPGLSKNRRQYRREVLQEAVRRGAFNGARAFAPDGPDHFGFGKYGRKRGPKELVGWWTEPHYEEQVTLPDGKVTEGVVGTFHVSEAAPWLKTMLADAWARQKPDIVGWSIVGDGDVKVIRGEDGRPLADVSRMDVVESIDPVVNPAAGGRTLRLVASKEGMVDLQGLTLAEAVRGLIAGTILPDELKEGRPDLARLIETFDGSATAVPAPAPAGPDVRTLVEAEFGKIKAIQYLEAKLAARPRLAEPIKARVRERVTAALMGGKVLAEAEVEQIVTDEVTYVGQFSPASSAGVASAQVTDMKTEREQMVEAAYNGLAGKDPKFSLAKFYVDLTGDQNFSGKYAEGGRLTESMRLAESITTATFAEIMGDSVTRRMLDYYNLPGLDAWRSIVNVGSAKDFRTYRRVRFGGYGNLPAVAQGDPYTALTTPGDEEATYAISKRGGTEDMTLEAIANDDLNALRDIPRRLGRAAAQTLHEFAFDFVATNPTIYDGSALFVAGHGGNLGATALDATTLKAGRLVMKKQADMSNSKRLGISPRFLLVPSDLEGTAYELTQTDREVGNANNTLNFVRTFGLSVIVVDYWTDANNWFLVADPNAVPTIEIAFFNGNQEPDLFVQDQPTVGNVFSNDKITYKIRHIYGGAVMDFRGFYGAIVA